MRKISLTLCLFAVATSAHAGWNVASSTAEPSMGKAAEHLHVVMRSDTGGEATLDLAIFAAKMVTLRVIDNAAGTDELAATMQRANCIAGVNGGYFDPAFSPIGLRVIDGAITKPLARARLLTGVLSASGDRGIEIVRIGEFSRKRKLGAAVECGPLLVDLMQPVRGLDDTRAARRTFAAVARGGKAMVGYCDRATLAELGSILSGKVADDFATWRALNLDGGSSSAFWFRRDGGSALSIGEYKNVRDFVGVIAK